MSVIKNKKEMIEYINQNEIEDITCNTIIRDDYVNFEIEFKMKNKTSLHFCQEMVVKPRAETMEVLIFGDSGNCDSMIELGKGFKPKKIN